MSQVTDRTVGANPTGFDMRTELNNIIGALETCNSGTSEPLNTVQFMYWFDTSNATYYYLKQRNHDNTAWNTILRYTVATKIVELVSNGTDLTTSFALKANLASPTFTGTPTAPTPTNGDNSTKIATTAFVLANATIPDATETVKGKVELATNAEVQAGTDTTRAITPAGMKAGLNASGTAPIYACRAWVNFNGTGTVAIRASGNVSSITDIGNGNYTVNCMTAMQDTNYSVGGSAGDGSTISGTSFASMTNSIPTSSSFSIVTWTTGANVDYPYINVQVFR